MRAALLFITFTVLAGLALAEDGIHVGNTCGNADTCEDNAGCYANICLPITPLNSNVPLGLGNKCSADDCCGPDQSLVCDSSTSRCVPSSSSVSAITCGGGGATTAPVPTSQPASGSDATSSPDSTASPDATGDSTPAPTASPTATPVGASNTACDNNTPCTDSWVCLANICVDPSQVPGGILGTPGNGNKCSETECCASGLSCYSATNQCAPSSSLLSTISCTGEVPTTGPGDLSGSPVTTITSNPGNAGNAVSSASAFVPSLLVIALAALTAIIA